MIHNSKQGPEFRHFTSTYSAPGHNDLWFHAGPLVPLLQLIQGLQSFVSSRANQHSPTNLMVAVFRGMGKLQTWRGCHTLSATNGCRVNRL